MSKFIIRYVCLIAVVTFSSILLFHNSKGIMAAYEEGDVSNGGTITGTVKIVGDAPETKMLTVDKDQEACGHDPIASEALLVSSDKGIKNAVVSLLGISKGKKFNRSGGNPTIDQKGCIFKPHVAVIPPRSTVDLLNSDDVMHNLHTWSIKNTAFNEGVAGGGKLPKTFEFPETIKVTCDVHKWMTAWLIVQDNPYYAITDENGKYKIEGVPPGAYTLKAWQESLGNVKQEVTVKSGEETKADFELKKKKKRGRRKKK